MSDQEMNDWLTGKDNHPDPPNMRDRTTDNQQEDSPEEPPKRIDPEQVKRMVLDDINKPAPDDPDSFLIIKPCYQWLEEAMLQPIPKMLFDEFWNEGEISILFADTNTGKSILAVQIADSISRGVPIPHFKLEAKAQPVIYFDFELSSKQFERRYSVDYTNHYPFSPSIHRSEIQRTGKLGTDNFEDKVIEYIEDGAINRNVKVLVIDNLTYLQSDNERACTAAPLMQKLMDIKMEHNMSMLILAHTPKRDLSTPLTLNHLQGSKALMSFADSSFCIGTSTQDKNLRYLKQVKVRAAEYKYTEDNVAICRIEKPHNFLGFHFVNYSDEREHLREKTPNETTERNRQIHELHEQGLSQQKIAEKLGIGAGTVNRVLNA